MDRQMNGILPPPWIMYPDKMFGGHEWQIGIGAMYLEVYTVWRSMLTVRQSQQYDLDFPQPRFWNLQNTIRRGTFDSFIAYRWCPGELPAPIHYETRRPFVFLLNGSQPTEEGVHAFNQWARADFRADGRRYSRMEQYMMAKKAEFFGDYEARRAIMSADDPRSMKKLGRQVLGFEQKLWDACKYHIVATGNYLKFAQNPSLRKALLNTAPRAIVEDSPFDNIWGIGMSADDSDIENCAKWGGNLLGIALMDVRDELARVWKNADTLDLQAAHRLFDAKMEEIL